MTDAPPPGPGDTLNSIAVSDLCARCRGLLASRQAFSLCEECSARVLVDPGFQDALHRAEDEARAASGITSTPLSFVERPATADDLDSDIARVILGAVPQGKTTEERLDAYARRHVPDESEHPPPWRWDRWMLEDATGMPLLFVTDDIDPRVRALTAAAPELADKLRAIVVRAQALADYYERQETGNQRDKRGEIDEARELLARIDEAAKGGG